MLIATDVMLSMLCIAIISTTPAPIKCICAIFLHLGHSLKEWLIILTPTEVFLWCFYPEGRKIPLSAYPLSFSISLVYLSILRQNWAAYWTQMMNGCGLMASRRFFNWHRCIPSSPIFVFSLLLLFFSQHSDHLGFRLVALKELYVPSWFIVMKYSSQDIVQRLFSRILFCFFWVASIMLLVVELWKRTTS